MLREGGRNLKPFMSKRFFVTLITTLILLSLNIAPANAVTLPCSGGGTFTIESNVVTESSDESTVACAGAVNIPSGVVKIEEAAFLYRPITSVTIPNTVTEIGSDAFEGTELVSVNIPDSVITLGPYVFLGTSTLTSVTIGNRVTSIGDDAFSGTRLTSVTIPNSVTTIGNRAFQGVSTLTSVTIPDSVTSIGAIAFKNNTSLTSVTFLGNAPTTFDDAFSGVPTGTKANVAYNATGFGFEGDVWNGLIIDKNCHLTITDGVLESVDFCDGEITIPNYVTYINPSIFFDSLATSVIFEENSILKKVNEGAFGNSGTLTSVTIPSCVTAIESLAFGHSGSINSISFLGNAPLNVAANAFEGISAGAIANVPVNASGFPAAGELWNGLTVSYGSSRVIGCSDSFFPTSSESTLPVSISALKVKVSDAVFNAKGGKPLSKRQIKSKLDKSKVFKNYPVDKYRYSVFSRSRKTCAIKGNFVLALKETGLCEILVTRVTAKGTKYKYWVKINYSK